MGVPRLYDPDEGKGRDVTQSSGLVLYSYYANYESY